MANVGVFKNVLCILKLVNCLLGLLITCVIAYLAAPSSHQWNPKCAVCFFASDRFNFMVTYGSLLFIWSLVTFLLFLLDVTSKCQPGTVRGMELIAALFLLLCSFMPFALALHGALKYAWWIEKVTTINMNVTRPYEEDFGDTRSWNFDYMETKKKEITVYMNLCASECTFIGVSMITLAVSAFLAHRGKFPGNTGTTGGDPDAGGAYVPN